MVGKSKYVEIKLWNWAFGTWAEGGRQGEETEEDIESHLLLGCFYVIFFCVLFFVFLLEGIVYFCPIYT